MQIVTHLFVFFLVILDKKTLNIRSFEYNCHINHFIIIAWLVLTILQRGKSTESRQIKIVVNKFDSDLDLCK